MCIRDSFKKAGVTPKKHLAEFKEFETELNLGDTVTVELFNDATFVDVVGLLYRFIYLRSIRYHIGSEQLICEHGVFQRSVNYMELYLSLIHIFAVHHGVCGFVICLQIKPVV